MEETTEPAAIERELPARLGAFEVVGLLGEGGSAVVYAARWHDQDVALKVARDERELTPREAERFLEEARMLARVRHECVVEVLDSGRLDDGLPYLVMRRYEGETLAAHLARQGALDLEHALSLFSQLADATSALHDAGLLHRDIKPENVFLIDSGRRVKLLDFGIAKDRDAPASTTTQAGIARGTPATMAPERFFGAAATELTDVYELAVVLYAMLVGRLPWQDATNVNARLNPESPIASGARIPEALSTTIMRALSTRPERRPRSVRELAERVRSAASSSPNGIDRSRVTAETTIADGSPPESGPRPAAITASHRSDGAHIIDSQRGPISTRKNRSLWLALIAAIALGGAGIAIATSFDRDPPATATSAVAAPEPAPMVPTEPPVAAETTLAVIPEPIPPPAVSTPSATSAVPRAPVRRTNRTQPPPSAEPPPIKPGTTKGKPKGAPCTRSNECASMLCAAETCQ